MIYIIIYSKTLRNQTSISKLEINSLNKFRSPIWIQKFWSRSSNNVSRLNLQTFFATIGSIGYIGFDPYPRTPLFYCQMNTERVDSILVYRKINEREKANSSHKFISLEISVQRKLFLSFFGWTKRIGDFLYLNHFLFLLPDIRFTCFIGKLLFLGEGSTFCKPLY